jgi:hypothetical protein
MTSCPKFLRCNAPICPLDPDWQLRKHLPGDPVCGLAQEVVKDGSEARLSSNVSGETLAEVLRVLPEMTSRWGRIKSAVERAKTSGSRMDRRIPQ